MRKFVGILVGAAIAAAPAAGIAADKTKAEPDVYVNVSLMMFEDQNAKIVNDVTLIPVRGVFESMEYDVKWDEDERKVTVESDTGVRFVELTIDSNVMDIYTFKNIMGLDHEQYTLEVPAQIMNDRTMIPLRAVSEAFGCDVNWDQDAYRVDISLGETFLTEGAMPTPTPAPEEMLKMTLSTDTEELTEDGEFDVYVEAENMPEDTFLSGIVVSLAYDKSKLEFVSGTMLNNEDEPLEATVMAENPEYEIGAKMVYVTIYGETARTEDGRVLKMTFKSLTGEPGDIALSNNYDTMRGFESYLMFNNGEKDVIYDGQNMIVDKTPLTVGETAPDVTEAPEATGTPDVTEAPATETEEPSASPEAETETE